MPSQVWVPTVFQTRVNDTIFCLSATHRGDMYQVRAALLMIRRPIIICECSNQTRDLSDYLEKAAIEANVAFFHCPWTREALKDTATRPAIDNDCIVGIPGQQYTTQVLHGPRDVHLRKLGFISEGFATARLTQAVQDGGGALRIEQLPAAMSNVGGKENEDALDKEFETLKIKWHDPDPSSPVVLVLHRDTGRTVGNAYPEMDSGQALDQLTDLIANHVRGAPPGNMPLRAMICGDVPPTANILSLGPYWKLLPKPPPGVTKRDLEAYFLRWAYKTHRFQMVVGFRSGVLDLFTLMGIPTLSLGLRNMAGEDRHEMLATPAWCRRVNVQYDQPRHYTTAWVRGRANAQIPNPPPVIQSPYWVTDPPADPAPRHREKPTADEMREWQGREAGKLQPFDLWTVEVGLRLACERAFTKDHVFGSTMYHVKPVPGNVVTTREARYAYLSSIGDAPDAILASLNAKSIVDHKDMDWRRSDAGRVQLQETPERFQEFYLDPSLSHWHVVQETFNTDVPI